MSHIFLKDQIYGVRHSQLQPAYICNTTDPLRKSLVKLCRDMYLCGGETNSWNFYSSRIAFSLIKP